MGIDVFGPCLAEGRIDGAYDKMIVRLGGLKEMPLRLLSPYQCFTDEQYQQCERAYREEVPGLGGEVNLFFAASTFSCRSGLRMKDKEYLLDLLQVGLIHAIWYTQLSPEFSARLKELIHSQQNEA